MLNENWRKSSYSFSNSNCVEVTWRKAAASNPSGNCVEVRDYPGGQIEVRNSRFPDGELLAFTPDEWSAFTAGVKAGEFDLLS